MDTKKNILENLGVKSFRPCICGSGKKFKYCCDIYPHDSYITEENIKKYQETFLKSPKFLAKGNDFLMQKIGSKECLFPGCHTESCLSHLIPKGKLSKYFSQKLGFMYQITDNIIRANRTIPISQATTFYGRCNSHDTILFNLTDKKNFCNNKKRLDELCFKCIGRAYRLKQNQLRNSYSLIKSGRGNEDNRQKRGIFYKAYKNRRSLYLDKYKQISKGKKIFEHYIFKTKRKNTIFLSNMFYLNMDFSGETISNPSLIFINIFPEGDEIFVIFSLEKIYHEYIHKFFQELMKIYQQDIKQFLLIINNIILYYNFFSVITEEKIIEKIEINYDDFDEQYPNPAKYKLNDENRVIFIQ